MKTFLTTFLLGLSLLTFAQRSTTETINSSLSDDGKTYSVRIEGEINGRPVYYNRRFNAVGMSAGQKNALNERIMDSLRTGKVASVPIRVSSSTATVFRCPDCVGRMKLQLISEGVTIIREEYPKLGEKSMFPLTITLKPGEYRLMYWQNKVLQIQNTFTVKAGEATEVQIK